MKQLIQPFALGSFDDARKIYWPKHPAPREESKTQDSRRCPRSLAKLEGKGGQIRDGLGIGLSDEGPETKPQSYDS